MGIEKTILTFVLLLLQSDSMQLQFDGMQAQIDLITKVGIGLISAIFVVITWITVMWFKSTIQQERHTVLLEKIEEDIHELKESISQFIGN